MIEASLGEFVAIRRRSLGLTQDRLASRAGVSRVTVSKIENGESSGVSLSIVLSVLDALGYTISVSPTITEAARQFVTSDEYAEACLDAVASW